MDDLKRVLLEHIGKARSDRAFHRSRKGGTRMAMTEAGLAAHKLAWLADLYRDLTSEILSRGDLEDKR